MTTQLPNGYEAVKVPVGAYDFCFDADGDLHFAIKGKSVPEEYDFEVLPGFYILLGRADELTEEQCENVVGESEYCWPCGMSHFPDYDRESYNIYTTAKASFRSLLASLHLEPHTTIILKKENV